MNIRNLKNSCLKPVFPTQYPFVFVLAGRIPNRYLLSKNDNKWVVSKISDIQKKISALNEINPGPAKARSNLAKIPE